MKHVFYALACAVALLALAGCAKDHLIVTNDGRLIESTNKPEIDENTGLIEYEDHEGRANQIPQEDVKEIKER